MTAKVCIDAPHAQRIADSLRVLPLVRREAQLWHQAADSTKQEADALGRASILNLDAKRAAEQAEKGERTLRLSESAKLAAYRQKAHRRAFTTYLFLALSLGAGYLSVTH